MKKFTIALIGALVLGVTSPQPSLADNYSCDVVGAITGTTGKDVLKGTPGNDVICGLAGDDEILGLGGDDVIIGGDGNDTIFGDDGQDILYGGPGADKLYGLAAADRLLGGEGADRLDGGASQDYLDGENGINLCIKSVGSDTYRNCYYDSAGPNLVSAAIDPEYAVIDSSLGESYVLLKIEISDPGVGYSYGALSFRNTSVNQSNKSVANASLETDQNSKCSDATALNQQRIAAGWGVFCRESGDDLRGIYLVGLSLPKGSSPGKWVLSSVEFTDKVGNVRRLSSDQLKAKGLNINFRQQGESSTVDKSKPIISSVSLLSSGKVTQADNSFRYQIKFKDSGTGINRVHLGMTNTNFKWNVESHLGISGSFTKGQTCVSDAGDLNGKICLVSGTLNEGTLEISGLFSDAVPTGSWSFDLIGLVDGDQNSTNLAWEKFSKKAQAALVISKNWGADFSDSIAPEIVELSWSKQQIDTGSNDQVFDLTIRVKDKSGLAALSKSGIKFALFPQFIWQQPGGTTIDYANLKFSVDRISGTSNDGVYKVSVSVPAHTKQGTLYLNAIQVKDSSPRQNSGGVSYDQITSKGWQSSIKNGL